MGNLSFFAKTVKQGSTTEGAGQAALKVKRQDTQGIKPGAFSSHLLVFPLIDNWGAAPGDALPQGRIG